MSKFNSQIYKADAPILLFLHFQQVVDEIFLIKARREKQIPVIPGHLSFELKQYYPSLRWFDFREIKDFRRHRESAIFFLVVPRGIRWNSLINDFKKIIDILSNHFVKII
jgi:hypothetical protein